ncbi:hypothetical protein Goari_003127, partial [Gossypium aridum]|nr:hypothetical protein [Gossypium aridum]
MRDDYRSPSRSRSMSRDRGAKDDYRSPRRSRSVSRSLSPRSPHGDRDREYRTKQRSPSPRENGQSLQDERDHVSSRSKSPRRVGRSPSRSRSRSLSFPNDAAFSWLYARGYCWK